MLSLSVTPPSSHPCASREIAIARSLLSLLEESLGAADVRSAADLADQLAEHLRRIEDRRTRP
jgi:hypothetical protein